jgi:hypothetical protein
MLGVERDDIPPLLRPSFGFDIKAGLRRSHDERSFGGVSDNAPRVAVTDHTSMSAATIRIATVI